jgi:large conductance mechanosensitive channel
VINFLILALVVFVIVKAVNGAMDKVKKKEEEAPAAPPEPSAEEKLLTEIRDLLKEKN